MLIEHHVKFWTAFVAACLAFVGLGFAPAFERAPGYTLEQFAPTGDFEKREFGLLSFNGMTRTARWTLERLDRHTRTGDRTGIGFHKDPNVPDEFAPSPRDYAASGFDIGHQAAAGNHGDNIRDTETVANACPQTPALNRGPWKALETKLRFMAHEPDIREVWVLTAAAWLPKVRSDYRFEAIGDGRIWVPTHCEKSALIVKADGSLEVHSWRMPNVDDFGDVIPDDFLITTDQLESDCGFNVWRGIPGENELESKK